MWLAWTFFAVSAVATAHYCVRGIGYNTFAVPSPVFAGGMLLIPNLICLGLRYWLMRIRRPWFVVLVFLAGIFLTYLVEQFGIFLFPGLLIVFQVLSGILFVIYWPLFVQVRQAPPPVPKGGA